MKFIDEEIFLIFSFQLAFHQIFHWKRLLYMLSYSSNQLKVKWSLVNSEYTRFSIWCLRYSFLYIGILKLSSSHAVNMLNTDNLDDWQCKYTMLPSLYIVFWYNIDCVCHIHVLVMLCRVDNPFSLMVLHLIPSDKCIYLSPGMTKRLLF